MTRPSDRRTLDDLRQAIASWFRTRIDLEPVVALLRRKPVPIHRHSWMYALGDTAVFLFGLQAASGFLLMLYYQPTEASAHESVQRIMTEVPYGWLVRSVHVWGASFFLAVVGLHLLTVLFARAYRRPRELVWISGVLMLGVAMASGFSGYLLPWNELSYYATRVGTQIPGKLPGVGPWLVHFLRGGEQLTGATITRFFAGHVMLAPAATLLLLAMHVLLTRVRGVSLPVGMSRQDVSDDRPFYSEFLLMDCSAWLLLVGTIVTLSVVWPAEVAVKADPLQPAPAGIKPEWYFLFLFQTLKVVPETVGLAWFAAIGAFLLVLPFVDRATAREGAGVALTAVFLLLVGYVVVFQVLAVISPGITHAPTSAAAPWNWPASLTALGALWLTIGFLVFYLRQLLRENTRVRRWSA